MIQIKFGDVIFGSRSIRPSNPSNPAHALKLWLLKADKAALPHASLHSSTAAAASAYHHRSRAELVHMKSHLHRSAHQPQPQGQKNFEEFSHEIYPNARVERIEQLMMAERAHTVHTPAAGCAQSRAPIERDHPGTRHRTPFCVLSFCVPYLTGKEKTGLIRLRMPRTAVPNPQIRWPAK